MMTVALVLAAIAVVLGVLYGRAKGRSESRDSEDAANDRADGLEAIAEERARLEREAEAKAARARAVSGEINDAAPPTLDPDARMDAADRWVRENADRLSADPGDGAAVRDRAPADPRRRRDP